MQTLDYSAAAIAPQIDRSLQRMKTDYIDIMQLHSPTYDDVAHGDGREGLKRAQEQGKVRFVSVSADDEAARKAIEIGECDTLQLTYNVLQPEPAEIIAASREKNMGIIDQGPIAHATYEAPRPDDDGTPAWDRARALLSPGDIGDLARVEASLRWLLSDPEIHTAIVGATNIRHLEANIDSAADDVLSVIAQQLT